VYRGQLGPLTANDVTWTKKFYALSEGFKIGETPIEDFLPKYEEVTGKKNGRCRCNLYVAPRFAEID
jgi:hypothetical protein